MRSTTPLFVRLAALCLLAGIVLPAHAEWHIVATTPLGSPAPGVKAIEVRCENDEQSARLTALCFQENSHTLRVIDSPSPGSATLANTLAAAGAVGGVNGGYFHDDFRPVGLVISNGKTLHAFEQAKLLSGIVGVRPNGQIAILRSGGFQAHPPALRQAVQCGPMLVENGRPVGGLNAKRIARRTAVATGLHGHVALVHLTSVPLADAATILSLPGIFGDWPPRSALNLDGGTSTGLWAGKTASLAEIKRVRNFLAVFPR